MTWHVWTDGSCLEGPDGARGWGGWAAVVEHGSDGFVVRGRVPETTNVRMELVAARRGLAVVPAGAAAVLHTDSTVIYAVLQWARGEFRGRRRADADLWEPLALELLRVGPRIDLLGKGVRDHTHRRAHAIAGAEAKGGLRGLPADATLDAPRRRKRRNKKRRLRAMAELGFFDVAPRPRRVHLRGCDPGGCAAGCPLREDAWANTDYQLDGA